VVVFSILVQGTTLGWLAQRLDLRSNGEIERLDRERVRDRRPRG
jgi:NhaP-type Na+/H+ and K+/H+ antiporter